MNVPFNFPRFEQLPIVVILRGFSLTQVAPIVRACRAGGLTNLEVTMNSDEPASQIQEAIHACDGEMNIGAGTVTNRKLLDDARAAGASFIVTPTLQEGILDRCREENLPIFPGALTPTEIHRAWERGASAVKVFPSNHQGPSFIKALRGPFPKLPLMPTGGVNLETIRSYLEAGANAFGIGNPILERTRIQAGDWDWLTRRTREFAEVYREFAQHQN